MVNQIKRYFKVKYAEYLLHKALKKDLMAFSKVYDGMVRANTVSWAYSTESKTFYIIINKRGKMQTFSKLTGFNDTFINLVMKSAKKVLND